jgi:hypothetical protein
MLTYANEGMLKYAEVCAYQQRAEDSGLSTETRLSQKKKTPPPQCQPAYVSIRQHKSAYVSIRQQEGSSSMPAAHTPTLTCIRQHTLAYISIRQHTSPYVTHTRLIR